MKYVRQRLIQLVIVVLAVTILTFTFLRLLPGDPAISIAGIGATEQQLDVVRDRWGLNEPIPVQYVKWLGRMVTGDLGVSSAYNVDVRTLVSQRLPVTLWLMFYTMLLSLAIAIPLGIWTAYRANRPADRLVSTISFAFLSIPNYILAVVLVFVFSLKLGWLPTLSRYVSPAEDPVAHLRAMVLPVVTLALAQIAVYQRLLRSDMVTTLQNDFVTLARAKGMSTSRILFRHALRPSTFTLITAAAVNVGALIGGTVIVETIFALPGMGDLTVQAIFRRDFLVVQFCVVVFAVGFVLINFLVDLLYNVLDPRIRHARALV